MIMTDVPYVPQPDKNSCALACYTMVARTFFPETTFDQVQRISGWRPGRVIWAFRFWNWIMEKGIVVEDHDPIDLRAWAEHGADGLKRSVSTKEFDYYKSKDNIDNFFSHVCFELKMLTKARMVE